jgi:hypothetical protein
MGGRSSTWWRALVALLLALGGLVGGAAGAASSPSFLLERQDSTVNLDHGASARFSLTLRLTHPQAGSTAQISLYPRVVTRSELAPLLTGGGLAVAAVSTTGNFTLTCDPAHDQRIVVTLEGRATSPRSACASRALRLAPPCARAACDGVYPLSLSVTSGAVTTTEWSLLAFRVTRVAAPLHVSLVVGLDPTSWQHRARAEHVLGALAAHPGEPLAIGVDFRTLAAASLATETVATPWLRALREALSSPLHRADVAPPPDSDFGGLAAHGFLSQVTAQVGLTTSLTRQLTGLYTDQPVVLTGHPSAGAIAALGRAGALDVVVPESALTTPPSTTLTWGTPFRTGAAHPLVLAADDPLDQLLTNPAVEPARRAALALGTLALLHYEAPSSTAARSVVLVVDATAIGAAAVSDLLSGLQGDPFATPSSLAPAFDPALVGTSGTPATRVVAPAPASPWSSQNVTSLANLVGQVASFTQAISARAVALPLQLALARAERVGGPTRRQGDLEAATVQLAAETSQFSVDDSPVTLTGAGTALPVTIFSRAGYAVTVVVHLITDRLHFPKGSNVAVALNSPTTSLRVPIARAEGSSLTLQIMVTTPDGRVTLARTAVQVRIAGTSVVGYLLTLASLLVLALWWWSTLRRRSRGRHAS